MNRKQAQHDAAVLPRIQELKAQGRSLREIADRLQQEGVPPPRRGGRWSHPAVGRILGRAERPRPEEASPPPSLAEEASPPPSLAEEARPRTATPGDRGPDRERCGTAGRPRAGQAGGH